MAKKQPISITHPELSKEWHPTKNGDLTPTDVTYGSHRKVWWKCPKGDDHEWYASIGNRARLKRGCAVCSRRKVVDSNCLATTHPNLILEWHPNKNGSLTPRDIVAGSNRKVWWKCPKGEDHIWRAQIVNRAYLNRGCPICSGHKVVYSNSLESVYPHLVKEFHPTKNGAQTADIVYAGGKRKYWWKCPKGDDHEWESDISHRIRVNKPGGCPICLRRKIVGSNRLPITNPDIAREWHPEKNGGLNPYDFTGGSLKKVWWKCSKGDDHEWMTSITKRVNSLTNCPICSNKKIVHSNCLKTTHTNLIKEWYYDRNNNIEPTKVGAGSHKRVWWKCVKNNNHVWKAIIFTRALQDYGCPFCTLTPQSREELVILFELKSIFKTINPKGSKINFKNRVQSIDIFIPELNLAIEYDGSYWHKDKREYDKKKTAALINKGIKVIRLRQKPLKKIFQSDILIDKIFDGNKITNAILMQIKNEYDLKTNLLRKINKYISDDSLRNLKQLDLYIDKILNEKAAKKLLQINE